MGHDFLAPFLENHKWEVSFFPSQESWFSTEQERSKKVLIFADLHGFLHEKIINQHREDFTSTIRPYFGDDPISACVEEPRIYGLSNRCKQITGYGNFWGWDIETLTKRDLTTVKVLRYLRESHLYDIHPLIEEVESDPSLKEASKILENPASSDQEKEDQFYQFWKQTNQDLLLSTWEERQHSLGQSIVDSCRQTTSLPCPLFVAGYAHVKELISEEIEEGRGAFLKNLLEEHSIQAAIIHYTPEEVESLLMESLSVCHTQP